MPVACRAEDLERLFQLSNFGKDVPAVYLMEKGVKPLACSRIAGNEGILPVL